MAKRNGTNGTNGTNGAARHLPVKRKRGRPSKVCPRVVKTIIAAIEIGSTYRLAAQSAGIHHDTFRKWVIRGEAAKSGVFYDFVAQLKRAEGVAATRWLKYIEDAAEIQWQAAAWKLERRHPESFGRRILEVNADVRSESVTIERKELVLRILKDDKSRDIASLLCTRIIESDDQRAGDPSRDNGGSG